MTATVQISRGIESLFGTRDENIRLLESGLNIRTRLGEDTIEIEGDPQAVSRVMISDQALRSSGAQGRNRTTDTRIFSPLLYRLSYLGQDNK